MEAIRARWATMKSIPVSVLIVVVFVAGFALGNQHNLIVAQSDLTAPSGTEKPFEPFWQVYNLIQTNYLNRKDITPETLVNGAIKGMMDSLGDQFSGYMDPETFPLLNEDLSGEVEGIGAEVETDLATKSVAIVNVLDGSPAEKVGLKRGDIFVKVNGEDVSTLSQFELVGKVRGKEGTIVVLTMKRDDELLEFTITRAKITVANVEYKVLDNDIGYIKLREFSVTAYQQIVDAIKKIDAQNLDGLIFDLRGNPGGLLSSAIDIGSIFVKDGLLLSEDFGDGRKQDFTANGNYANLDIPITVLVDENSASAAELVAGALQDQKAATIIGVTTFGKGTVQSWQELVNKGGIRLTTARWLTPNGSWIHGNGITPDILIEWPEDQQDAVHDPQLQGALDYLAEAIAKAA
ncbi:MAG: S41 family peptidase [Anaerolineae bacterium]